MSLFNKLFGKEEERKNPLVKLDGEVIAVISDSTRNKSSKELFLIDYSEDITQINSNEIPIKQTSKLGHYMVFMKDREGKIAYTNIFDFPPEIGSIFRYNK